MLRALPAILLLGLLSTAARAESAPPQPSHVDLEAMRDAMVAPVAGREAVGDAMARPAADLEAMADAVSASGTSRFASPFAYRHYLQARLAETSGDLILALAELRQAAAYDFESAELRLALGKVYVSLGDLDQAELEMKLAIEALDAAPDEALRASVERELRSLRLATLAPTVKVPVYEAVGVE